MSASQVTQMSQNGTRPARPRKEKSRRAMVGMAGIVRSGGLLETSPLVVRGCPDVHLGVRRATVWPGESVFGLGWNVMCPGGGGPYRRLCNVKSVAAVSCRRDREGLRCESLHLQSEVAAQAGASG